MPKLKPVKADELIKAAGKLGFKKVRQKGGHVSLLHSDGRTLVIPVHKNKPIKVGLLNHIIKKDLKISRERFFELI